jgi:hypothetical protein
MSKLSWLLGLCIVVERHISKGFELLNNRDAPSCTIFSNSKYSCFILGSTPLSKEFLMKITLLLMELFQHTKINSIETLSLIMNLLSHSFFYNNFFITRTQTNLGVALKHEIGFS